MIQLVLLVILEYNAIIILSPYDTSIRPRAFIVILSEFYGIWTQKDTLLLFVSY